MNNIGVFEFERNVEQNQLILNQILSLKQLKVLAISISDFETEIEKEFLKTKREF